MSHITEHTDNCKDNDSPIPSSVWGEDVSKSPEDVRNSLLDIKTKIAPCKPKIIGVTKYYGAKSIAAGYEAGLRDFGESRVLDAIEKINALPKEIRENSTFHFIGHLQSNKAEKAVEYFDYIHSVDSVKLAVVISDAACRLNKREKILLQVNNSGESQKFGYDKESLIKDLPKILELDGVELVGLMNMAPLGASPEVLREVFSDLRVFRDEIETSYKIELPELSMGMSDDYEYAVKEGATIIRIGRKLFK